MSHRIAILFEYPTLNGGERSMLQLVGLIDPGEFQLVALAPATGRLADALRVSGIRHVPFALHDTDQIRRPRDVACQHLLETVHDTAPDVLHANSLSMGRLTGAVAPQLSIPCLAHLRDIIGLSRAAIDDLNRNRALIAVSQAARDFHVAQGLSETQTCVRYNAIDAETFRPRTKTHSLCAELRVPPSSFLVVTIGQIGLRKGQDVLAAAAPQIAARIPDVQFVIVGERNSSKAETIAYEAEIQAVFARAGLASRLHCLGYRADVPDLLNEADLLVHPAKQEPLGRVLLEAAAAGLPIVATDVGGTREIVSDGTSARLVAPHDHEQLAAAVIELAGDEQLRNRFAIAARQRVIRDFSPRATANDLMELWRRVLRE